MTSTGKIDRAAQLEKFAISVVVAIHALVLLYLAYYRYIDRDEGFYLSSAFQIAQGKTLYADFFFPQMPFLPYFLSLVSAHGIDTLLYSRMLCLIPAVLTPAVLYFILREVSGKAGVRTAVLFLYCFAGLVLVWHSVAKTYAWTDFWLLVLFLGLIKNCQSDKSRWWILAGLSFAMAVNFRSVLIVTAIPLAYALESGDGRNKIRTWLPLLLSVALVSYPTIRLLVADPARFYFDNLGFHFVRNPGVSSWSALLERGEAVGKFLADPQNWIVFAGLIVAWRFRKEPAEPAHPGASPFALAAMFAAVISLVYLFPSPVHVQYFEQAIPFALIAAVPGFERLLDESRPRLLGLNRRTGIMVIGLVYSLLLLPFAVIYLGGSRKDDAPYRVRNMTELCQFVHDYPEPGPVLSEWSGVPVLSGRESLPGVEYVGFEYKIPFSTDQQRAYHLPVNEDLRRALEAQIPALYVVWNQPDSALATAAFRNYHLARAFDQFKVLVRNEAPK